MLRTIRASLAVLCLVLLSAGYIASQMAYPNGAAYYATRVDRPAVVYAALALLLAALVLAFLPADPERDEP